MQTRKINHFFLFIILKNNLFFFNFKYLNGLIYLNINFTVVFKQILIFYLNHKY